MTLQSTPAQQPITDKLVTPQWLIWFNSIVSTVNGIITSVSGTGGSIDMGDWLTGSTTIDMGDRY
jgi:hypothetical protein